MSTAGLCQICESDEARHSCDRCGQLVCDRHYEPSRGFCATCARTADPGGPAGPDPDRPEGDDTYQF
jgi:hypothetical protein